MTNILTQDRGGSNLSSMDPHPGNYTEWIDQASSMTHGWHSEEVLYPYNDPHYSDSWGHFSQLVWRDSTQIGCAMGYCPTKQWACRFYCCKSCFFAPCSLCLFRLAYLCTGGSLETVQGLGAGS